MTCEGFGIELEKERLGALGPAEQQALQQHLLGCGRCREERAAIHRTASALGPPDDAPRAGWDELHARLERFQRRRRRELLGGVALSLAVGAALLFAHGRASGAAFDSFGSGLAAGLGFALLVVGGRAFLRFRRADPAVPGTELIAGLRRDTERRLRMLPVFCLLAPLWLAGSARFWGPAPWVPIAVAVLLAALAVNAWFRVRPRLRRELRELEGP